MKSKEIILYFLIVTAFLVLIMPITNFVNFINKNGLLKINEIKKETLLNTDKLESLVSFTIYKLFGKSIFPDKVVIGNNNFLFLGNSYSNVLDKTNGAFTINNKQLDSFVFNLYNLQKWYENQGIKFVIAIAPNKHSIYKEYLPKWIYKDRKTITDYIVENSKNYNINILDLRSYLLDAKQKDSRFLYHKTDTHWNMLGASYGYERVIDYMNSNFNLSIIKPNYRVEHMANENEKGDLFGFLKVQDYLSIDDKNTYFYSFSELSEIYEGNINNETLSIGELKLKQNPITAINWQAKYTMNPKIKENKLLFLCDSFGKNPSQLYNESFNTIWKFHHLKVPPQKLKFFIKEHKPNIVLYQIVERDFYNFKLFEILKD